MKSSYILICLIINISICLSQENPQVQKTILINTNLTNEELCQIFSGPNNITLTRSFFSIAGGILTFISSSIVSTNKANFSW